MSKSATDNPAAIAGAGHVAPEQPDMKDHFEARAGTDATAAWLGQLAAGPLDRHSAIFAAIGGLGFFAIASLCLALSRFDATLATLWLPNGFAVAVLLLARMRNEIGFFIAIAAGSITANLVSGNALAPSAIFTTANLLEVLLVTVLVRRTCGDRVNMTDLSDLTRFIQFGGLVGPAASTVVSSTILVPGAAVPMESVLAWFVSDSMGMILTVPAALLIADAMRGKRSFTMRAKTLEHAIVLTGGLLAGFLVFWQGNYPMLFLIQLVTLLVAFRLGGLGTAVFVPCIAVLAGWMTFAGFGPIAQDQASVIGKMFLLQTFVAANFLSGLPIAAVLAGRERIVEEMVAGRNELALLAENVTDAVIQLDLDGRMIYASPSTREVLGRAPESMVGDGVTERAHIDASERIANVLKRMQTGESEKERITYRRLLDDEDGAPVFIEADCAVAKDPTTGERIGFIVSARDVTERVELELLLTRARRHAENAARAKSEFLANMSHEIRTPMNGVLGFAELILQDDLDPEHRRHTEMIVQSGRSMMMLLNDILDLSKIEAGQIAIDEAPVDLHATISECAALHRASAEKKGIALDFICRSPERGATDSEDSEQPWVVTDALRLRQIILNLVGNAVKFTERGRVEVSYWASQDEIRVEVSDTGIGISPSRIETVFAPFTQGESDTARRFGGTGLGLTISRQLAELLGGTISVESEPGKGSKFTLALPANYAEAGHRAVSAPPVVEPEDLPQSARVLLVEDHDVNRLLGTEMLERCGQSVAIAHDGNEAIAMVIDSVMRDKPYDLVLMDIQMPGCDGYAATRAIRAEGIGPDMMPIVALTANAFPEDIAAARDAGMQAHLAKPLVFADLARALQRWLPTRIIEARPAEELDVTPGAPSQPAPQYGHVRDIESAAIEESHAPDAGRGTSPASGPISSPSSSQQTRANSSQSHSPELLSRWTERRSEAIEAVRDALQTGALGDGSTSPETSEDLARLVHKLAGTAAIFGEPELGDQAAAFERALRTQMSADVKEALAFELLSVADDPADRRTTG